MKKILFLLLSTIAMYGQVPADATQLENIQITNNVQDLTAEKVNVQSTNGVLNWQFISDFQNNKPYFSTGLLKNGLLTINTDNTKFDLSAGIGVYSDFSDPENVTSKVFNFPAFNAVSSPYLTTSNITYVAVNYNGGSPVLVMQASKFSNTQLRDLVVVGAVVHSNFTTINTINNISSPSNDVGNSVADLFNFLGAKNQEGNVYSSNGANLQLNKSAGVMFKYGANFHVNAKNPHNVSLPEQLSLTFRYRLRGGFEGTDRINIDTDNYDLNNVLTTVPPAKPFQIQTIFIPQTGQTRLQYGQDTYSTLADAIAAINTRKFVTETNLASQFVKVAYLVVKKGATSLNVAADADIRQATQFDGTASGGVAITYQSIIDALSYTPANDVDVVKLTGNQTITTGIKSFLGKVYIGTTTAIGTENVALKSDIINTGNVVTRAGQFYSTQQGSQSFTGVDIQTDAQNTGAVDHVATNQNYTKLNNIGSLDKAWGVYHVGDKLSGAGVVNNAYGFYHAGWGGTIGKKWSFYAAADYVFLSSSSGLAINTFTPQEIIDMDNGDANGLGAKFNNAWAGNYNFAGAIASFGHYAMKTVNGGLAFLQLADGTTFLNSKSGKSVYLTSGLVNAARITPNSKVQIGNSVDDLTPDTGESLQVLGDIKATTYTGGASLTGTPTAPTAVTGNSTTQIATTAFVHGVKNSLLTEDNAFTGSQLFNDTVTFSNIALLKAYTVATLPTGSITGAIAYVTDGLSPTYRATATGGGSEKCLVFYDGTVWRF